MSLIIMTYARVKLTNRSFRPMIVADSNVNFGFCHDLAANDNWPPNSILCNLATVSKKSGFFLILAMATQKRLF